MEKRKANIVFIALMILIPSFSVRNVEAQVRVGDLRCEYGKDPIGIGTSSPRFFWKLYSEGNNQAQTAWQVLVASSPEELNEKRANLWNSGKVNTGQSIQVNYDGNELKSKERCWWKVRVWDLANGTAESG